MEYYYIYFALLQKRRNKKIKWPCALAFYCHDIIISLQARSRISSTVKAIIEERRRHAGNISCKKSTDFLEILLCVDTLSEDEKVSFVLDSLLGGYETTSLLMSMVVFFLHQSPSAVEQLKVIIHS